MRRFRQMCGLCTGLKSREKRRTYEKKGNNDDTGHLTTELREELTGAQKMSYENKAAEVPTATLTWHASKYKVHKLHLQYILKT